ncbi:LptF/LptG family permease [bacterium]|nr:LptF/LptG family permease [bacterium]
MKILSRYVLSELLQVFLVALGALTLFMLVVGLVKEAQQQGLGILQIAQLVPYVLPEAMRFAVPGTMLFAVASVFGRMSSSNEITALKAAGVTPLAAIWPALGLAVVVSLISVWLNDIAVSWGRDGVRRVIVGSVEEIIYGRLRQQRSYSTSKLSINVKGVEGRKLVRPTLSFQPGGEAAPVTVSAAEAEMRADPQTATLTITCRNGTLHVGDVKAVFPDTMERVVPLDAVSRKETASTSPSEIPLAGFAKARVDQIALLGQIRQLAAAKTAIGMFTGRLEQTTPPAVEQERQQSKQAVNSTASTASSWSRGAAGRMASVACASCSWALRWRSGCATPTSSRASSSASCRSWSSTTPCSCSESHG